MRRLLPLLAVLLVSACRSHAAAPANPAGLAPPAPRRVELAADLAYARFFMLPADQKNPMGGSSTFGGRCSRPAAWISVFDVAGALPELGDATGFGSHCAVMVQTAAGPGVTYFDGRAWYRGASGEDLLMTYGDGRAWSLPEGWLGYRDQWRAVGGTGRFAGASGAGTDSGTANMATNEMPPYRVHGTVVLQPAGATTSLNLRGRMTAQWSVPHLVAGTVSADPCAQQRGAGWLTFTLAGEGAASELGEFTFETSYCGNLSTGAEGERRVRARTANGSFSYVIERMEFDMPFTPGLDRAYSYRSHGVIDQAAGGLSGLRGEFWAVGKLTASWRMHDGQPVPVFPMRMEADLAGRVQR